MINSFLTQKNSTPSWEAKSASIRETIASFERTLEESRRTDERAAEIRKAAAETQKSTQETIDRLGNTINRLQDTINGLQETSKKIDEYEAAFKSVIEKAVLNLSNAFGAQSNLKGGSPIKASAKSAAEAISNCKKIMLLTGAGLSVASGIPTFRGEGGFWTIRDTNTKLKAIDFLTYKYFLENPSEIWRWHHTFKLLKEKSRYNNGHREIAEFQCFCLQNNIPLMLATQNIDEFHVEAFEDVVSKYPKIASQISKDWKDVSSDRYGLHPQVFAIHGSVNYIRHHDTTENAPKRLYPYPVTYDNNAKTLPLVGDKASRPHTLLFDENYNEEFYRSDTVTAFSRDCDCLIVVGTALETSMALRIVSEAIRRKAVVIEVNPDPCIEANGVLQLKGTSEEFLKEMFLLAQRNLITKTQPIVEADEEDNDLIEKVEQKALANNKQVPLVTSKQTSQADGKQVPQAMSTTIVSKQANQTTASRSMNRQRGVTSVANQSSKPNNQSTVKKTQAASTTSTRKSTMTTVSGSKGLKK